MPNKISPSPTRSPEASHRFPGEKRVFSIGPSATVAATSDRCAALARPTLPFLSLSLPLSHDVAAHRPRPSAVGFRRGHALDGHRRGQRWRHDAQARPPPERCLDLDGRQSLQQRRRPRVSPSASPAVQDRLGPVARPASAAPASAQLTQTTKATTASSRLGS
jgi:hypothetical protein